MLGSSPRAIRSRSLLSALLASNPPLKILNLIFAVLGVLTTTGSTVSSGGPPRLNEPSSIPHCVSWRLGSIVQPSALHQASAFPKPSSMMTIMLRSARASVCRYAGSRLCSLGLRRTYQASERGVAIVLLLVVWADVVLSTVWWLLMSVVSEGAGVSILRTPRPGVRQGASLILYSTFQEPFIVL